MRLRGAEAVVRTLEELGIEVAFGMCGHGNLALLDALIDSPIRFISVHHEQVAVHAADAYFRLTGRPAVVVTTLGPGMLNTATGLGDAALDGSAVIVISGDVPSRFTGLGSYQELEMHASASQIEVTRPLTKRSYRVGDPAALAYTVRQAWRESTSGCPGPVHVHIPLDLLSTEVEHQVLLQSIPQRPALADSTAEAIIDQVAEAKRPVLYAGGGVLSAAAWEELRELAEVLQVPVATSMIAQGAMPERHPLALGFTGAVGVRPANAAVKEADLVVAVGTRFPEMDSSSWRSSKFLDPARCRLVHIDIDSRPLYRTYNPVVSAVADAREALGMLLQAAKRRGTTSREAYLREIETTRQAWQDELQVLEADESFPIQPPRLIRALREILPDNSVLVAGVGVRHMVGQHYPVLQPRTMLVASGFSTMGWESGATLGAAVAVPGTRVVGLIGDGALNSTVTALPTAVAEGINALWVILDNGGYQSIAVYQDRQYGRRIGTDFVQALDGEPYRIDYVALARAYGAAGERVTASDRVDDGLRRGFSHPGNYLIEVPTAGHSPALASGQWDVNTIAAGEPDLLPATLG
ncbi:MAG: thiamine pyrophosphate-binding protein [Candidatus Dormibacteria bacterium]